MRRVARFLSLLPLIVMVFSTLIRGYAHASVAASDPVAKYIEVQDSSVSDLDKVKNATETFFTVWYDGLMAGRPLDAAELFSDTPSGRDCRRYLAGRVSLNITSAQYYNDLLLDYELTMTYESPEIAGDKASITALAMLDAQFTGHPQRDRLGDAWTFRLVEDRGRWRIDAIVSGDVEFQMHPMRKDLFALAGTFAERTKLFEARDKALSESPKADPELAWRFTESKADPATRQATSPPITTWVSGRHNGAQHYALIYARRMIGLYRHPEADDPRE